MASTSPAPRAVVFIGPPKTASTHVQELLANNQDVLRTLGWTWPRGLWGSPSNAKSFANLATALSGQGCSPHYQVKAAHYLSMMSMCRGPPFVNASRVVSFFASEFERVRASSAPNLVFSAEDLAFFDGTTAVHRIARKELRRLLSGYASVDVVIAYRTPRVHVLHSLYTEEINEATTSQLATDAYTQSFSGWLQSRLSGGQLFHEPPYSSSINIGRLAESYMSAGFHVSLMDLSKLMCAPAYRTLGDVVACTVMRLPCRLGMHFDWPISGQPETFVTHFDDFEHHAALVTPHMLRSAGCTLPSSKRTARRALLHSDLLAAGAVQRCSDWRGLEALLLSFDAPSLARYNASVVPHDAPPCPLRIPSRQYCELALESSATWDAMQQVAQARGFVCKVAANATGQGGQRYAPPRIATLAGANTSDASFSAFQPPVASSSQQKAIAVVLSACMASTMACGAVGKDGRFRNYPRYTKSVNAWATFSSLPVVFVERSGANISCLQQLPSMQRRTSFEFLSLIPGRPDGSERVGSAARTLDLSTALSLVHALEHSWLLRRTITGADDLIFLTAAHHYVAGLQEVVRAACWSSDVLRYARPWPSLAVQNPTWRRSSLQGSHSTPSVIGFTRRRAHDLFGWSELPWASRYSCLKCHISHVVNEARNRWGGQDVCELPDLTWNSSVPVAKRQRAKVPHDVEDPETRHPGMAAFFDGRWICFANQVQLGQCVANLPKALCSSDSNLSLAECVKMCDGMPGCQMVVHNQPSHSGANVRGCWLKERVEIMRRDHANLNTHSCVPLSRLHLNFAYKLKHDSTRSCTDLVLPVDVSPVRSPQSMHDVLAREFASARAAVLEIGARNGDSIHCFARFARAASVIEGSPPYCRVLEKRAHGLRQQGLPDFAVECGFFPQRCSTQPLLCSHVDVFTFWVAGGQRHSALFARDGEHPLVSSDLMFELAKLHAHGRTLETANVVVLMDLSMRGHMHDLRAVASRNWADWMAFVPYNEERQCRMAANRGDGGGLARYGGKAVCGRARGAFMAVAIPLGKMVQQGEPVHLHEPARGFAFHAVGLGCCRLAPSYETSKWRAILLGSMFASDCATACEMDRKCAAFELVELDRSCRIKANRKPRHTCTAKCWLFLDVVGLPFSTGCDRKTGKQVCYAKEFTLPNASQPGPLRAAPEEARSTSDVLVIGGGPNALRLLTCLGRHNISAVAYEREDVGATISKWYSGAISHSTRDAFMVGDLEPTECSQCLESIWTARNCSSILGKMHCGRDEYLQYLRRAVRKYHLNVHSHERVVAIQPSRPFMATKSAFVVTTTSTRLGKPQLVRYREARTVVMAFGSSSVSNRMRLVGTPRIVDTLSEAAIYRGRFVLVVGTGPSGMESAVRLCTAFGARHVTLASRSQQLWPPINQYINQSLERIRRCESDGRLTLLLRSQVVSANLTHAALSQLTRMPHRTKVKRPLPRAQQHVVQQHVVRADVILSAIGATSDKSLIESVHFANGDINPKTSETSVRGLFNLGVSNIAPWRSERLGKVLGTFIEDTQPRVQAVCDAVVQQHQGIPEKGWHQKRDRGLEPQLALDHNSDAQVDVAAVLKGAPCSSRDSKGWPKGTPTHNKSSVIRSRTARVYVILSACVNVFLDFSNLTWVRDSRRNNVKQQVSSSTRLAMYERSVAHWAVNTSTPIVFVENSGANLASLRRHVPTRRQQTFEFLSLPKPLVEDIGRAEAMTVLNALQHSRLLSGLDDSDLIFLVTARYTFVQDFESTVRRSCGLLPMLVLQNPPWVPMWARQETSILGFNRQLASHLFGWALPSPSRAHLQRFIDKTTCNGTPLPRC